jgi:hypothetical protein
MGLPPPDPRSLSSTEFVEPPTEKNSWVRHCTHHPNISDYANSTIEELLNEPHIKFKCKTAGAKRLSWTPTVFQDSVLRHRTVGRAKDLSAPPRIFHVNILMLPCLRRGVYYTLAFNLDLQNGKMKLRKAIYCND